ELDYVVRAIDFYHQEFFLLGDDDVLTRLDVPTSAEVGMKREWLLVELREDWQVGARTFRAGSLIATRLGDFLAGGRDFDVLFEPTDPSSLAAPTWTRSRLVLTVLDDVADRRPVPTPTAGRGPRRARTPRA